MMKTTRKQCVVCGKMFDAKVTTQVCCSDACRTARKRQTAAKREKALRDAAKGLLSKTCLYCGETFHPKVPWQITCGKRSCETARARKNNEAWLARKSQRPPKPVPPRRPENGTPGAFALNVDPYATGALPSDAMFCPVI